MDSFEYDVCIVGTGRVGLPLGLSFVDVGVRAVGVDLDPAIRSAVNGGTMPFREPGYQDLVTRQTFKVDATSEVAAASRAVVITVGTPLHPHVETDLRQIQGVLAGLAPFLRRGQLVCLRSTVAPGTTDFVRGWIERNTNLEVGKDVGLAFCPERIAEGRAREELRTLPQVVGSRDPMSRDAAAALFSRLAPEILHADYVSAELVKLFNNTTRYVHFAVANQCAVIAEEFGADVHEVIRLANHRYPRGHLASPGFTAGTCLRKDFGMISEWTPYPDLLLAAWKVNEFMPAFLVRSVTARAKIRDRRVAVLGYAFKADTDDTRDSLAPKLVRYVLRELPEDVRVSDYHLPPEICVPGDAPLRNWGEREALDGADVVFVAANHERYRTVLEEFCRTRPDAWIADLWGLGGVDGVVYQGRELARQA